MKQVVFGIVAFLGLLPLQAQQINTAQEYYDYVMDRQAVVEKSLVEFSNALESDSAAVMYEKLKTFREECDKMAAAMTALPPFQGHTAWRDAAKELYIFYRQLCEQEYVQLVDYSLRLTQLTEAEYKQLSEMMAVLNDEENKRVEAMNAAMEDFLKKFGPVKMRELPKK
jgi:leucyl-tRNA synthetase